MTAQRDFYDALAEWQAIRDQITPLQLREKELRQQLFAAAFPTPREGANNYALPTNQIFRATHKITRSVDQAMITPVRQMLHAAGSNYIVDDFLRVKHDLNAEAYKTAPESVRVILDRMLTTKPAMPHIEIVDKTKKG